MKAAPAADVDAGARAEPMPADEEMAGDAPDGDAAGYRSPCVQSTLQLSVASRHKTEVSMEITGVRLYQDGNTAVLSTIDARDPTRWADGTYVAWNQSVPANASYNTSYKLADPDWAAVTKATGQPAWGPTYVVEVDIMLDGQTTQTIRSTPVPREMPEEIQT